jgi:hypothetical protein
MKSIAVGLVITTCLLGQQRTYNVQTCSPGQTCTTSQVGVTPQQELDPSIILQGKSVAQAQAEWNAAHPYHAPVYRASQPTYQAPKQPKAYGWRKMMKDNE